MRLMPAHPASIEPWQYIATATDATAVLPDGCCDLIWHARPHQRPVWFVTELADRRYDVPGTVGEHYCGFRLQPGTRIDTPRLLSALQGRAGPDGHTVLTILHDCTHLDPGVHDALQALSECESAESAARALGVSPRSLQRWIRDGTGRTPGYWRSLARVRRAARDLARWPSLADAAAAWGYADQAHMGHEFRRWLGTTPGALATQAGMLRALAATGYG